MVRSRFSPLMMFGLILVLGGLTGCLDTTLTPQPPASTPTPAPSCDSSNTYYSNTEGLLGSQAQLASSITDDIYVRSLNARTANNEGQLSIERSKALQFLAYETQRWSRVKDVKIGENGTLRVVMTFVSPELIHAVILNHVIYGNIPIDGNNLNQYTQSVLARMDARHEYLVLLSVQAELPAQTAIQVDLTGEKILLKPGDNPVQPSHTDSAFAQPFSMATGQRAGLVYFPIQIQNKKGCRDVMDIQRDQFIPLDIAGAKINEQELPQLDFAIPFVNPLGVVSIIPTPNPNAPFQPERYVPAPGLPSIQDIGPTGTTMALTAENLGYWQDMGRFVWATLTLGYFQAP